MEDDNTPEGLEEEQDFEAAFNDLTTETPDIEPDISNDNLDDEPAEDDAVSTDNDDSETDINPDIENTEKPEGESEDLWANATQNQLDELETLRRQSAEWQHRYQSDEGRVSALQRKINDLQGQLQQPALQQPTTQESALPSNEELEAFKNDYPDIANAIDAHVQRSLATERNVINQQLAFLDNRMQQSIQPIHELEQQRYVSNEMQALNHQHPDWQQVVQTTDFLEWINVQPEPVRNLINSDDSRDASFVINSFKMANNYGQQASVTEPEVEPEPQPVSRNQQRLEQAVAPTPRRRRSAPKAGVPDNFEDAFAFYARND